MATSTKRTKKTRTKKTSAPPTPVESSPFDRLPARVPVRQSARDFPITSQQEWSTVTAIRGALTDLERGQFTYPAMMLDAMLGDSHIVAKLEDRVGGVFGAPFDMVPPPGEEENDAALEIAEQGRAMWPSVGSDKGDRAVARDGIMLGAGLGEVIVEPSEKEWRLRLKHWNARHLWWNWGTRSYHVNTLRGTEELKPDGRGGFFSIWRDEQGAERVTRWILYTPYGYQRGWVEARIKALAIPWILRMWAFRDFGRHSELLGIPPRKVKMPAAWDDTEKQKALREVASMASEGIIRCTQDADGIGFDVELMELKGPNGWEAFTKLIEKAEAAITIALVGQTLTTQNDQKGGSRALGQVHERVEAKLRKTDADSFSAAARAAIVFPWCEFNFGSIDLAPFPTWAVDPPEDLKQKGDGLTAVGTGLLALQTAGVPVDRAKVCQEAGIPLEEGKPFTDPQPMQDPGAPGGSGANDDEETKAGKEQAMAGRISAQLTREIVASGRLGRRARAPFQGQAFVDELAANGRDAAARLLAGDVRALRRVIADAKPDRDGRIDAASIKAEILRVYRDMKPDRLAKVMANVRILAELSGRYAVTKEVVSK